MQLSSPSARFGCSAHVSGSRTLSRVAGTIGFVDSTQPLEGADIAYALGASLPPGGSVSIDAAAGTATSAGTTPVPSAISISGSLSDGSASVDFPVMSLVGYVNGKPSYVEGDYSCTWNGTDYVLAAPTASWSSNDPVGDPTEVNTWSPDDLNYTGTPAASASGDDKEFGIIPGDGQGDDFEGLALPSLARILSIMIEVESGELEVASDSGVLKISLKASSFPARLLWTAPDIESALDPEDIDFSASGDITNFRVFVIGISS